MIGNFLLLHDKKQKPRICFLFLAMGCPLSLNIDDDQSNTTSSYLICKRVAHSSCFFAFFIFFNYLLLNRLLLLVFSIESCNFKH